MGLRVVEGRTLDYREAQPDCNGRLTPSGWLRKPTSAVEE